MIVELKKASIIKKEKIYNRRRFFFNYCQNANNISCVIKRTKKTYMYTYSDNVTVCGQQYLCYFVYNRPSNEYLLSTC